MMSCSKIVVCAVLVVLFSSCQVQCGPSRIVCTVREYKWENGTTYQFEVDCTGFNETFSCKFADQAKQPKYMNGALLETYVDKDSPRTANR